MEIVFKSRRLAKILNSDRELRREYGTAQAETIKRRMAVLAAAACLEEVPYHPPDRRHELSGDRRGQFAVDLKDPYRLVFEPSHYPLPRKSDGGLDLRRVTAITILAVEDYHR